MNEPDRLEDLGMIVSLTRELEVEKEKAERERERASFWEERAKAHGHAETYYREELEKAHALLGRVLHQTSERWDSVNLTPFFPTTNPWRKRTGSNPSGEAGP